MLSWLRTYSPPKRIWCLPRIMGTSSAIARLLSLKGPGAQVPQEAEKPWVAAEPPVIGRPLGKGRDRVIPMVQALIPGAGPRTSTRRLTEAWKVLMVWGVIV